MPPPAAPDAEPLRSLSPLRFERCRCADLYRPVGLGTSAGALAAPYRRCPVGVIADVDCPEFVGARCVEFEDRGPAPAGVVSEAEVGARAGELARDYLTPKYRRRVAMLRDGTSSARARRSVETSGSASSRGDGTSGVAPLNVPADRPDRSLARPPGTGLRTPCAAPSGRPPTPPEPTDAHPRHLADPTDASSP